MHKDAKGEDTLHYEGKGNRLGHSLFSDQLGMAQLTPNELWDRVRGLQGEIIYTIEHSKANMIHEVTDSYVRIKGRKSRPTRREIEYAYEWLWKHKSLHVKKGGFDVFIHQVTPAILLYAVPDEVAKVPNNENSDGYSGITLKT